MGDANAVEAANPNHQHFINAAAASAALVGVQIRIAAANNMIVIP
jgi:hypothetical protein